MSEMVPFGSWNEAEEQIEWPTDQLPSNWEWSVWDWVFQDRTHSSHKLQTTLYQSTGAFPIIDQGDKQIAGWTDRSDLAYNGRLPVVIFGDHTRKIQLAVKPFVQGADGVKVLAPTECCNAQYLGAMLRAGKIPEKGYSRHFKFIKASRFPIAPLTEQRRIVAKLDALQSRTRLAREALAAIPALLDHYRQSVLAAACSGQLNNQDSCTSSERTMPDGWQLAKLGELSSFITSGSRGWSELVGSTGSIFIRSQDINSDKLELGNTAKVNVPSGAEGERTKVKSGDLLITITGANVGRCAWVDCDIGPAYVSQHVALIRPSQDVLAEWIHTWVTCNAFGRGLLHEAAYGGGKPGLNLSQIRDLAVWIPPLETQRKLISKIQSARRQIAVLESLVASLSISTTHLDQSLLATAFRGELVPQDPTDEPASVLLARIRAARDMHRNDATTQRKTAKIASVASSRRRGEIPPVASSSRRGELTADPYATLLSALRQGGSLASADAQAVTGLDATAVRPLLQRLVAEGAAQVEGQKRGTRYVAT